MLFFNAPAKRTLHSTGIELSLLVAVSLFAAASVHGETFRELVEADWLRQAAALSSPGSGASGRPSNVPTWADAAGAVDGVKDGKYAFHTDKEPNPWWQVDLGEPLPVARIVVYNRLDYAPGEPKKNLALRKAADQSSISQWSTAKVQAASPGGASDTAAFPIREVIDRARHLAADLAAMGVDVRPFDGRGQSRFRCAKTGTVPGLGRDGPGGTCAWSPSPGRKASRRSAR